MNSSKKILLVGLGGIGCRYDFDNHSFAEINRQSETKTHYGAGIQNNHEFIGGVDINPIARQIFENFTSLRTWSSIKEIKNFTEVDILVISTSTASHLQQIQEACNMIKPKAILCEKPFGRFAQDSLQMIEISEQLQIPILVNYSRNFSKGFRTISNVVGTKSIESGFVRYSQGLRVNGSHFLRFVIELLGVPKRVSFDSKNYKSQNPSFTLYYSNDKEIEFSGSDSKTIRLGEIFLETDSSTVKITEGMQFEVRKVDEILKPTPWFKDLKLIDQGDLSGGMNELYRDTKWMDKDNFSLSIERNYRDHACNEIMDNLLSA